jgi:hypothetical protein
MCVITMAAVADSDLGPGTQRQTETAQPYSKTSIIEIIEGAGKKGGREGEKERRREGEKGISIRRRMLLLHLVLLWKTAYSCDGLVRPSPSGFEMKPGVGVGVGVGGAEI